MRRGISLLEVLFAIFVLAVGLLGLASMIPVGKHQITEAGHADRGTAIGQQAFSEIKVRDLLDPEAWVRYDATAKVYVKYDPAPATVAPFVIDPLAVSVNAAATTPDAGYAAFPYGPANFVTPAAPDFPKMDRVSLQDVPIYETTKALAPIGAPLADRIFRCSDDLIFDPPADETLRPVLVNSAGTRATHSEGNYSWLVTVTPQADNLSLCTVSVVVFHKRDLVVDTSDIDTPASERIVYCDLIGGGVGGSSGSDVQLRVEDSATFKPTAKQAERVLHVRQNQWILVSGQRATSNEPFHKWYRVVGASPMESTASPWVVDVTLAGPDLIAGATLLRDIDAAGVSTCYASIFDGVIGVYEKVIQLDEPSPWTSH